MGRRLGVLPGPRVLDGPPRWALRLGSQRRSAVVAVQSLEEVERTTFLFLTLSRSYRGLLVTLALQQSTS